MRAALLTAAVALSLAAPAAGAVWSPSPDWLAQAQCVHAKEGGWRANSGNGYFGGMQFSAGTWRSVGGKPDPAFTHPGTPFAASAQEQLYRAWLLWKRDGGSWRSWGAVGVSCSSA
jgi:transglycosylase-like protein